MGSGPPPPCRGRAALRRPIVVSAGRSRRALGFSRAELQRCALAPVEAQQHGLPVDLHRSGVIGCNALRLHILIALGEVARSGPAPPATR